MVPSTDVVEILRRATTSLFHGSSVQHERILSRRYKSVTLKVFSTLSPHIQITLQKARSSSSFSRLFLRARSCNHTPSLQDGFLEGTSPSHHRVSRILLQPAIITKSRYHALPKARNDTYCRRWNSRQYRTLASNLRPEERC
jgi:hypothetical protein